MANSIQSSGGYSRAPHPAVTSFSLYVVLPVFLQPSYPIKVYKPEIASAASVA